MTLAPAFFYLFAFIMVAAGFMVIAAKNPVHAVLFLILAFFNAAGLFVLLGAEFLAMILVVVYVGAVAVLFLFVVMMLDVDFWRSFFSSSASTPCGPARWRRPRRRSQPGSPTPRPSAGCSIPSTSTSSRPPASSCWLP
jgi:hypothetical protein